MLKLKLKNVENIKIQGDNTLVEYEINQIRDRLIFPTYISNNYIEAIELIVEEDDYYLLVPCDIKINDDLEIVDYNKVEDFDDINEYLHIFISFKEDIITEFDPTYFLKFLEAFFDNLSPNLSNLISSCILKEK